VAELTAPGRQPAPRWWVRGDLDGFLGLGLDNLI
jgi:AGZA family xanthine/uracil permease-like MFS transporter